MQIIAAAGRRVVDPATRRRVGAEPITVNPHHPHWARLIADGDVVPAPDATKEKGK